MNSSENEVELIVEKKIEMGITYYKVKWKGYSDSSSTWEPIANIMNSSELIRKYEESLSFRIQNDIKCNEIEENRFCNVLEKHKPIQVKSVIINPEGMLVAYLVFNANSGIIHISDSVIPTYILARKYPDLLIDYYESKLKFV